MSYYNDCQPQQSTPGNSSLPIRSNTICAQSYRTVTFRISPNSIIQLFVSKTLQWSVYTQNWRYRCGESFLQHKHDFVDMCKDRTVVGAEEEMYRLLKWAGLDWDEGRTPDINLVRYWLIQGPGVSGVLGPYRQVLNTLYLMQLVKVSLVRTSQNL